MMSRKAREDMTWRRENDKHCQITKDDNKKEKIESDKTAMRGNWGAVERVDSKVSWHPHGSYTMRPN